MVTGSQCIAQSITRVLCSRRGTGGRGAGLFASPSPSPLPPGALDAAPLAEIPCCATAPSGHSCCEHPGCSPQVCTHKEHPGCLCGPASPPLPCPVPMPTGVPCRWFSASSTGHVARRAAVLICEPHKTIWGAMGYTSHVWEIPSWRERSTLGLTYCIHLAVRFLSSSLSSGDDALNYSQTPLWFPFFPGFSPPPPPPSSPLLLPARFLSPSSFPPSSSIASTFLRVASRLPPRLQGFCHSSSCSLGVTPQCYCSFLISVVSCGFSGQLGSVFLKALS